MLSEISQWKTNTSWSHLCVESLKKKTKHQICRYGEQISDCQSQGVEGGQYGWKESKGTNSCYKISHRGAQDVQHDDYG